MCRKKVKFQIELRIEVPLKCDSTSVCGNGYILSKECAGIMDNVVMCLWVDDVICDTF